MGDTAINIENLSKEYVIGTAQSASIRDVVSNLFSKSKTESFLALDNINLKVEKGEALAIIGKNGAGKSTLLKVLSRITYPTKGKVEINGKISSLLEVGTGFHPELSGRENIFLNGTILGMKRQEIRNNLDEIIHFSGIEKFIDTPVKRYSSGMYVRLAFAVAAHLEPEILVVDEVLAVGDVSFQKKCLGKMNEVASEGRTVLFVSHNMNAVKNLCRTGTYLENGKLIYHGSSEEAIGNYAATNVTSQNNNFPIHMEGFTINAFNVSQQNQQLEEYSGDYDLDYEIEFTAKQHLENFRIGVFLKDELGDLISRSLLTDWNKEAHSFNQGKYKISGSIPSKMLTAGNFFLQIHTSTYGLKDYGTEEATSTLFKTNNPKEYNSLYTGEPRFGVVINPTVWGIKNLS